MKKSSRECVSHSSRVRLFATARTVALQAPLFMGFSRQEYWSGLLFLLQGIFPPRAGTCVFYPRHAGFPRGEHRGSRWKRKWQPTPVLLPGKFHGQRSLEGCSPWGPKERDTTERLTLPYKLCCTPKTNTAL